MKKILMILFVLVLLVGCNGKDDSTPPELSESDEAADDASEKLEETPVDEADVEEPETEPEEEPETQEDADNETSTDDAAEETDSETQVTGSVVGTIITNKQFDPKEITIKVGDSVKWVSENTAPIMISGPKGTFNTKIYPDETYTYTFEKTGRFSIIKLVDPIYFQKVYVEEPES